MRAGGARCDRAKRAGEVPAAVVMVGRRLADADAALEACDMGADQRAPVEAAAIRQRQHRRENGRRCMQHDAGHVGVVEIEHVAGLAVGERRFHEAELHSASEHGRLRLAAQLLQNRHELAERRMPAAGERAAEPVEHAPARFMHRGLGQVLVAKARDERGQIARDVEPDRRRAVVRLGRKLRRHRSLRACRGRHSHEWSGR